MQFFSFSISPRSRGVEPWDRTDTIYVERLEADGTSSVSKSDDFLTLNRQEVITGIKDFEVRDDYLFATQVKSGVVSILYMYSVLFPSVRLYL